LVQCAIGCSAIRTVKVKVKVTLEQVTKAQRALGAGGRSTSRHGLFTPGNDLIQEVGWVPGPVWTVTGNLTPTGIRSPDRPVRSVSLYRLICPGPPIIRTLGQILLNDNIKEDGISGKRVKQQEKKNAKISVS
jgi:hypothetical protein